MLYPPADCRDCLARDRLELPACLQWQDVDFALGLSREVAAKLVPRPARREIDRCVPNEHMGVAEVDRYVDERLVAGAERQPIPIAGRNAWRPAA